MQTFARQSTTLLTTSLRAVCQIGAPEIEELSYDQYLGTMGEHPVCAVLSLDPWPGRALLTFDQAALLTMVDHQLGGPVPPTSRTAHSPTSSRRFCANCSPACCTS